jgi:cyclic beta-1,2-glucan synthetase
MHPSASLVGNGRYATLVRPTGTGFSAWDGLALTHFSADPTRDAGGLVVYLRDPATGRLWSVGRLPAGRADHYTARAENGTITLSREDGELATTLTTWVVADADVELRRVTVENRGGAPRALEIGTYAEIVLHDPAWHLGHPAFSKLFVETEAIDGMLLARRRPRSRTDRTPCLVHALVGPGAVEWDTDRALVLGRGHDLERPRALDRSEPLAGTTGSVLDPVLCLRRRVEVPARGRLTLFVVLGAGASRDEVLALGRRFAEAAACEHARPATHGTTTALPAELRAAVAVLPELRRDDPPVRWPGHPRGDHKGPENGYGRFVAGGSEYAIRVDPRHPDGPRLPPMPWTNVVANPTLGFLASETGAGYTWSRNSREHRLTPWANDPIADPHGEAIWIRDDDTGEVWSAQPGPTPADAPYEARHGFGYSRWTHDSHELAHEVTAFVAERDPVKLVTVRLANRARTPRRLTVVSYAALVLGVHPGGAIETETADHLLLARNRDAGDFADGVAFAAAVAPGGATVSGTTDRAGFIGRGGLRMPAALQTAGSLDGRVGAGLDPCFALSARFTLRPNGEASCTFLLGETAGTDAARALVKRFREPGAVARELDAVSTAWRELLGAVQIETPSAPLDRALGGWLLYQTLSCRLWGRSALYQSGGAFGFRDQLQDATALVYARPDLLRAQIVLHAGHQFVEGDVLHWWHPPADRGTRTRFADDRLWLPYVTAFYARTTGDDGILDEEAGFVTARALEPGEDEAYVVASRSEERASVYEHCCRAIDRSLATGAHGLPLMGTGDWNDGMNRVGREGRGESVWMGWFLYDVLGSFVPFCVARGDGLRARRYHAHRTRLRHALESAGWDGAWYRRAYYDDGTPLGSAASDECRIDAIAQAWAVISQAAPRGRAEQAMASAERMLVDEGAGVIRLLTPPFDATPHDPGYIKGYVPGIRENGGQYTHAALWLVRAAAELGWRDRAVRWLEMLAPAHHARDAAAVERYKVEPYVVAADVYGVPPHVGRGGWTWYTGSAAWMYRVALESILGITLERGRTLRIAPRIPDDWPGFKVRMRLPGDATTYEVAVENPAGRAERVVSVAVDEQSQAVRGGAAKIPLKRDGETHRVVVRLGAARAASARRARR